MGNTSNLDQWAAMERMRFIERCAYWRGVVNRQDLAKVFGLSMAQASADLQEYQRLNPGALVYNLNRKRYEGAEGMVLCCTEQNLEEAMVVFLSGGSQARGVVALESAASLSHKESEGSLPQVYVVKMPSRRASAQVERRVFMAVLNGLRIRVKYYSLSSGTIDWRWLQPSAFCHNGSRWHIRAWCENNNEWRDFNLSRIDAADWPVAAVTTSEIDQQRLAVTTLRLKAAEPKTIQNKDPKKMIAAVELDFDMEDGVLELKTTLAEEDYLRARLRLPLKDGKYPEALVEEIREPN